jgi:hypothetical protein
LFGSFDLPPSGIEPLSIGFGCTPDPAPAFVTNNIASAVLPFLPFFASISQN